VVFDPVTDDSAVAGRASLDLPIWDHGRWLLVEGPLPQRSRSASPVDASESAQAKSRRHSRLVAFPCARMAIRLPPTGGRRLFADPV